MLIISNSNLFLQTTLPKAWSRARNAFVVFLMRLYFWTESFAKAQWIVGNFSH